MFIKFNIKKCAGTTTDTKTQTKHHKNNAHAVNNCHWAVTCMLHVSVLKTQEMVRMYKVQIFQFLDIDTAGTKEKHVIY